MYEILTLICMTYNCAQIRCTRDKKSRFNNAYINKWKNHFYEMKGDVGMSVHEKERKQEDAYTKTQTYS